jgi:predicted transcriptional regulator YheO
LVKGKSKMKHAGKAQSEVLIDSMKTTKDKPMNKKTAVNVKVALTAIVGVFCMCADASPLAVAGKAVAEKITAKSAVRTAATAVGRGSAALVAVNAERAVARSVSGRTIGDVVKKVSLGAVKKFDGVWLVRQMFARDEKSRDKDKLEFRSASVRTIIDSSVFDATKKPVEPPRIELKIL